MSEIGKLSKEDWKKVGIGACVAGAGAVLTYLAEWATGMSFGTWTPIVVGGLSILANAVRKIATNTNQ